MLGFRLNVMMGWKCREGRIRPAPSTSACSISHTTRNHQPGCLETGLELRAASQAKQRHASNQASRRSRCDFVGDWCLYAKRDNFWRRASEVLQVRPRPRLNHRLIHTLVNSFSSITREEWTTSHDESPFLYCTRMQAAHMTT